MQTLDSGINGREMNDAGEKRLEQRMNNVTEGDSLRSRVSANESKRAAEE